MKPIGTHNYFVYIVTNNHKTVIYTDVTNDLKRRLCEHYNDAITTKLHFAGKYGCYNLIYFERFEFIEHAIAREKQIKGLTKLKKCSLIGTINPNWDFLNENI